MVFLLVFDGVTVKTTNIQCNKYPIVTHFRPRNWSRTFRMRGPKKIRRDHTHHTTQTTVVTNIKKNPRKNEGPRPPSARWPQPPRPPLHPPRRSTQIRKFQTFVGKILGSCAISLHMWWRNNFPLLLIIMKCVVHNKSYFALLYKT